MVTLVCESDDWHLIILFMLSFAVGANDVLVFRDIVSFINSVRRGFGWQP